MVDHDKLKRFLTYFESPNPYDCWIWDGPLNGGGYGRFAYMNERWLAHRVAYEFFVGPIPTDTLDHLCRNTRCVNPEHLEAVTRGENVRRGLAGKYQQNPLCPQGHEYDRIYIKRSGTAVRVCSICNNQRCSDWYYRNKAPVKRGVERPL